jgi:hypothetical protein
MTTTVTQSPALLSILTSLHGKLIGLSSAGGLLVKAEGYGINFSAAPSTSNICLVTCTLVDYEGFTVASAEEMEIWLSDAATGLGITATTASGAVAANTGTDLAVLVTKKMIRSQLTANGVYILSITDTSKTGFFVAVKLAKHPKARVSAALVSGNYG